MPVPELAKNYNCCGCSACAVICPKDAITMQCNEYGFEYPKIDSSKCINCKKCTQVCPIQNDTKFNSPKYAFAAVSTNTDVLKSASGGVFASFATEFIKDGGFVAGASLEKAGTKLENRHICINSLEDLTKLLSSKYVQSDTKDIFLEIKELLLDGKKVLYSGTPCQIDALYSFLGKDFDNLFTIDLICHGVPSRKMFSDYIDFVSDDSANILNFTFRDKSKGLTFVSKLSYELNGKIKTKYIQYGESSYYYYFLKGNTYRDYCYNCKYAKKERTADITIGDFWGIKSQHPELFDGTHQEFDADKGISCILQNTEKGIALLNKYGTGLSLHPSEFEKIANENSQLSHPSVPKGNRLEIMDAYKNGGYKAFNNYFANEVGSKQIYISKIKKHIPSSVKKLLKS